MKIAYVTTYDASDMHAWSGSGYHILRALQSSGIETESIGNLKEGNFYLSKYLSKVKRIIRSKLIKKTCLRDREPTLLKSYASQVKREINMIKPDVIFSPGTIPIAYLETEKPVVFWTDATFAGMVDFYPEFTNLCSESIRNGNEMEQQALSKCRLAIYSSEWAAQSAIQNYDIDPEKVKVVPFGANINCDRGINDIEVIIDKKEVDICKLLFVGVDWQRKGGDKALAVAELLNKQGLRTELHVVGCTPPFTPPSFVKTHGFISKKNEDGQKKIDQLFSESHFLIVPSRAECFGVVFAEASSFGLPSLATKVGGIPTVIRDGKNGWTFKLDAVPEEYCKYIKALMTSNDDYRKLSLSCYQEYAMSLNWNSAGIKVVELMKEYCG